MIPREKHFPSYVSSVTHFKLHQLLQHAQNLIQVQSGQGTSMEKREPKISLLSK